MTGTLIVSARTWDAQNKTLRDYEDKIEQLQADVKNARDGYAFAFEKWQATKAELAKANLIVDAAMEYVGEKNQGAYGEIVQDLYRELDKAVKSMEE